MRVNVGDAARPHTRLAGRYMMCSVMVFFCELDGKIAEDEWDELIRLGLLTPDEKAYIMQLAPQEKRLMLLNWSTDVAYAGPHLTHAPRRHIIES